MRSLARRHPHAAALAAYAVLAVAATWPLLPRVASGVAGRGGLESWRTLWSFWWWGESLARGASPFWCDVVRWPHGASMWLQGFDVPATALAVPTSWLTAWVPEFAVYNVFLLAGHAFCGFALYLLARELWGGHLAPFLSGALYAGATHHLGSGPGDPAALSMVWAPLYFLALVRTVRRHGIAAPLLGGIALAAAAASSPYQLAFCCLGTALLLAAWWRTERATVVSGAFLRRSALLGAVAIALSAWLYVPMIGALLARPHPGAVPRASPGATSPPVSVDLLAFFVPGAASAWRRADGLRELAGEGVERGAYIGWVALVLAVLAARRAKAARPWVAMALAGFVLALGPRLRVGGWSSWAIMPFGYLERLVPALLARAEPARLAGLVPFGVAVAAGAALSLVVRSGRRGPALAAAVVALALVESWPRSPSIESWPAPRFLRDLAHDGERWAVLDLTSPSRQLWNQVLHRHPQLGDPASEAPRDASDALFSELPEARSLVASGGAAAARHATLRALQSMKVRFILADERTVASIRPLRLTSVHDGDGLVVFEVPPPIQMASRSSPR